MDNVIENSIKISVIHICLVVKNVTISKCYLELEKRGYIFQRYDGKNRDYTS
jgi:hypothetical protein